MKCFNLFKAVSLLVVLTLMAFFWGSYAAYAGWTEPVRILPGGTEWPQIVAQGDTLHVTFWYDNNNSYRIAYIRSTDRGNTWGQLHILSGDSCSVLFPRIIGDGQHLMVLWKTIFYVGYRRFNIGYNVSSNNGRTWSTARYLFNPNLLGGQYFAASGDYSAVNIISNEQVADSIVFSFVRSTNFGQNWSSPRVIFRSLQNGQTDQASNNNYINFTWDGRFDWNRAWETYQIMSTDAGLSWSENQILSTDDGIRSELPAICTNQSGKVFVIWMDGKYSPYIATGDILGRESPDSGLTWGAERQVTFTHYAWYSDVASNGDTIHVVWDDESAGLSHRSIYYTRSTDNGTTWSEPYWIDGTLDDSWDPALASSAGKIYIVWSDARWAPDSVRGGLYISRFDPQPDAINEEHSSLPAAARLGAYPNPFNSSVTITYSNLKGGEMGIYDVQGKLVKTFKIDGGENGKIKWDATDAKGNKVSSGEYFLKAEMPSGSKSLRLVYLK